VIKRAQIWVDSEYHRVLKVKASEEGISLLNYTKKLADEIKEKRFNEESKRFKLKF
jgi:hypothetical protein